MPDRPRQRGFTLIELITVTVIISILAAMVMPLLENSLRREKEIDLRRALRQVRQALDDFKKFVDDNKIKVDEDTYGYPESLEKLVEGIEYTDKDGKNRIVRFLRRIPYDPMGKSYDWGKRSYQDRMGATRWGGENVYDVYTTSPKKALDGTLYKDW